MKDMNVSRVQVIEGGSQNYFRAFYKVFGGEITEDSYLVNNVALRARGNSYMIVPGMELIVADIWFEDACEMDRLPDDDPSAIHINLNAEAQFVQAYDNREVQVETGNEKGAFLYNGLFPLKAYHPGKQALKSLSYKFKRESLMAVMPEALYLFDRMFDTDEAIAYHSQIPPEIDLLVNDVFHYQKAEFGNRAMVTARGIEILYAVFRSIRKLSEKKQLNGLHVDDFERLQKIRSKLQSSLENRTSLDALSDEFGISVSKLKRDFKSLYDCSVYQFHTKARMDEAYRRLKSGKYSVMEVGYDLGYQNLSKFSEMFKKMKGLSPKEVI